MIRYYRTEELAVALNKSVSTIRTAFEGIEPAKTEGRGGAHLWSEQQVQELIRALGLRKFRL